MLKADHNFHVEVPVEETVGLEATRETLKARETQVDKELIGRRGKKIQPLRYFDK